MVDGRPTCEVYTIYNKKKKRKEKKKKTDKNWKKRRKSGRRILTKEMSNQILEENRSEKKNYRGKKQ